MCNKTPPAIELLLITFLQTWRTTESNDFEKKKYKSFITKLVVAMKRNITVKKQ